MKKAILTLGIESSCDETSVSVVKNGREVLSNVKIWRCSARNSLKKSH